MTLPSHLEVEPIDASIAWIYAAHASPKPSSSPTSTDATELDPRMLYAGSDTSGSDFGRSIRRRELVLASTSAPPPPLGRQELVYASAFSARDLAPPLDPAPGVRPHRHLFWTDGSSFTPPPSLRVRRRLPWTLSSSTPPRLDRIRRLRFLCSTRRRPTDHDRALTSTDHHHLHHPRHLRCQSCCSSPQHLHNLHDQHRDEPLLLLLSCTEVAAYCWATEVVACCCVLRGASEYSILS